MNDTVWYFRLNKLQNIHSCFLQSVLQTNDFAFTHYVLLIVSITMEYALSNHIHTYTHAHTYTKQSKVYGSHYIAIAAQ